MKRYNRHFCENNFAFISKYGQILPKKRFTSSKTVKFWEFVSEIYHTPKTKIRSKKYSKRSIYLFRWPKSKKVIN